MSVSQELQALMALRDAGELSPEEYASAKARLLGSGPRATGEVGAGGTLGNYRLIEKVGVGGMGVVYRARHVHEGVAQEQGGDVAVKLIHAQYADNAGHVERFFREAQLGMKLSHPNLLRVYETVNDGGRIGMVMAWAAGRPLSTIIGSETGPIPWERAKPLVWQLLDAVSYAHGEGVVHRDLKPENVMVDHAGGLKVLDFGIAKASWERRTKTGMGLGTVDYMAPEQFTGASEVDARADIYALGMTLYEMLAGRLPWGPETPEFDVLDAKRRRWLPPPTAYYPDIPGPVVDAVMACLVVAPGERPRDVGALRAALSVQPRSAPRPLPEPPPAPEPPLVAPLSPAAPQPLVELAEALALSGGPVDGMPWWAAMGLGVVSLGALTVLGLWGTGGLTLSWSYVSPTLGTMAYIPAGTFTMGCERGRDDATGGCNGDEVPHTVTLTQPYYMMEHEVTQAEWSAVMGSNPSGFSSCGPTCPVEQVSWNDAQAFIAKVSARDGVTYRLPTEAEWEYAARGGAGFAYAGSVDLESAGWFWDNAGDNTHPVCGKARNGFGLCDMSGNVFEWTADFHGAYTSSAQTDPYGPASGSYRVARGGGWSFDARDARVANRVRLNPDSQAVFAGFRLVRSVP